MGLQTATDYCVQLLQLLRSNDTINAHFLWKRIADSVKVDPQLHAVWGIGAASLTEGNPAELTKALAGFAWQPPVAALVDEVRRARVDRTMSIIGRAYSTISLEQVAAMSGLDGGAAAAARCASEGWRVEGNTVHPAERAAASRGSTSHGAAMRQLEQLSTYVTHLEAESTTKLLPRLEVLVAQPHHSYESRSAAPSAMGAHEMSVPELGERARELVELARELVELAVLERVAWPPRAQDPYCWLVLPIPSLSLDSTVTPVYYYSIDAVAALESAALVPFQRAETTSPGVFHSCIHGSRIHQSGLATQEEEEAFLLTAACGSISNSQAASLADEAARLQARAAMQRPARPCPHWVLSYPNSLHDTFILRHLYPDVRAPPTVPFRIAALLPLTPVLLSSSSVPLRSAQAVQNLVGSSREALSRAICGNAPTKEQATLQIAYDTAQAVQRLSFADAMLIICFSIPGEREEPIIALLAVSLRTTSEVHSTFTASMAAIVGKTADNLLHYGVDGVVRGAEESYTLTAVLCSSDTHELFITLQAPLLAGHASVSATKLYHLLYERATNFLGKVSYAACAEARGASIAAGEVDGATW